MNDIDFDKGLAPMERIWLLANTPLLHLAARVVPAYGMKTKRSATNTAGLLLVGAASVVCGSDRAADCELRWQWPMLRDRLRAAGIPAPDAPLQTQMFRDWRDRYVDADVLAGLKHEMTGIYVEMAKHLGLFPEAPMGDWLGYHPEHTVMADGSWWQPASAVGYRHSGEDGPRRSRATKGEPRLVHDADVRGKAVGYCHVMVFAQGPATRQRMILSIERAPNGNELATVIPMLGDLRSRLDDRLRCFIYDGAMEGEHHRYIRESMGIVTVNKPKGVRSIEQWKQFQGAAPSEKNVLYLDLGCGVTHPVNVAAGMMWEVGTNTLGKLTRHLALEHLDCRRTETAKGFHFDLDVALRCPHGDPHILTLDPSGYLSAGGRKVNLASKFRMLPMNDEVFRPVYGLRNTAEGGFSYIKNFLSLGGRAGSFTGVRHELDLILAAMLMNASHWAEHRSLRVA